MTTKCKAPPRYYSLKDISATTIRQLTENVSQSNGCIIWKGPRRSGYGRININGKATQVHRWLYQIMYGELPEKMDLDHLCRNRACLKLHHLEPVSRQENIRRGLNGVLKTHCFNGHPWNETNTFVRSGIKRCSICRRKSERSSYIRSKLRKMKAIGESA